MLQTVTVTKDQQNPISITLSEDQAKSLKNKEKLKVSIKQKQSKKTSKDFFFEVGIDPKVEAKQKEKLLELDKVKKQIEDSINGDAWLPEKPEGEKPVQNTNKELQLQELNKKYQMAKEAIESATTLDDVETQFDKYTKVGDKDKYPDSLRNQYTQGDKDKEIEKAKKSLGDLSDKVNGKIEEDKWLSAEVKKKQQQELEARKQKVNDSLKGSDSLKSLRETVEKASSKNQKKPESFEDVYVPGNEETEKTKVRDILQKTYQKTEQNIETDPWLSPEQKKAQKENAKTRLDAGLKAVETTESLDKLKEVESDFLDKEKNPDSIPNQHKAGTPEVARKTFLDNFEKEAKKEIESIKNDVTLTDAEKATAKAKVEAQLQEAKGKAKESKSFDDLKNIQDKVEQAKLDAIKSVDDAQTADAINDALGKGIENINNQYQHGDGVDVRKATAKGDLEKEAAKVKALIAKDPTLTQADKDKQTAAVDAAKNTAIAAVDKATTAEGINQELGKGITAINKAYRPGEGVKARKEAAKADLEKEAAKVKALIAKDPTLTQADKDKQTAAVDAAKNTAIAAVDKATTADGVNQELGKGITAINKAYRPGEGVKARKEAAKADLEKEAAKVKALITNDPTLTKADKAKQTGAVAKALKAAIAAVDKATTAEGINQELGKGITAINKAYRPGEGVKARKEAAKANLEKVAKETKALISGDRYLSETEKAAQKQAVEQALAKALGQVEAAKTVEAVKLAENLGTVAIRSAYVAGLAKDTDQATAALNEAKQAAIEALKQAAAETLAKITTDAKLTEAQKAEQSENVSLALKTAIATVRSAQSIASVKEAKDKGITAIRAAYVPNKAVAKSSSANHLPKSGDANSIVLVGLGVMSLLLGMVLYSKKKESKD